MELEVTTGDVAGIDTAALVVNLYQGVKEPSGATAAIDHALDGQITALIQEGEITGQLEEITIVHTAGRIPARRVVVVGLGKKEECDLEALRKAMGTTTRRLLKHKITRFHTILHGGGDTDATGASPKELAQALAESAILAGYRWDQKTVPPEEEPGDVHDREKAALQSITV